MYIKRMEAKKFNLCHLNNVIDQSTNLPACNNTVSTTNMIAGSGGWCSVACQVKFHKNNYSFCTFPKCKNIQDKTLDRRGIFCTVCWGEHEKGKRKVCKWCQVRSTSAGWQCGACRKVNKADKEKKFPGARKNGDGNTRIPPSP